MNFGTASSASAEPFCEICAQSVSVPKRNIPFVDETDEEPEDCTHISAEFGDSRLRHVLQQCSVDVPVNGHDEGLLVHL